MESNTNPVPVHQRSDFLLAFATTLLALLRFMDARENAVRIRWLLEIIHNGLTTFFVMCTLVIGTLLPLYILHKNSWLMGRVCPEK